jgi:hypothetical protein
MKFGPLELSAGLSVLCVSAFMLGEDRFNRRDAENAEIRREITRVSI